MRFVLAPSNSLGAKGGEIPQAPSGISHLFIVALVACGFCAAILAADVVLHKQRMWIMDIVWPITALYAEHRANDGERKARRRKTAWRTKATLPVGSGCNHALRQWMRAGRLDRRVAHVRSARRAVWGENLRRLGDGLCLDMEPQAASPSDPGRTAPAPAKFHCAAGTPNPPHSYPSEYG
jgi:hypothetical protein